MKEWLRRAINKKAWILLSLVFKALSHNCRSEVLSDFIRDLYARSLVFSLVCLLLMINVVSIRRRVIKAIRLAPKTEVNV